MEIINSSGNNEQISRLRLPLASYTRRFDKNKSETFLKKENSNHLCRISCIVYRANKYVTTQYIWINNPQSDY